MSAQDTTAVIRSYYDAWTSKEFGQAVSLLAPDLTVEVPVNDYPDTRSFAAALESFGSMTTRSELLAAMSAGKEGMLLYDMDVQGLGDAARRRALYRRERQDHRHPAGPRHSRPPRRRLCQLTPAPSWLFPEA